MQASTVPTTPKAPRDASEAVLAGGPLQLACGRQPYASLAFDGRPERIMPRHFGLTGAPRDGQRCAASIKGLNGTSGKHGAAGQRRPPERSDSRVGRRHEHLGAARPAAGAFIRSATRACCTAEKRLPTPTILASRHDAQARAHCSSRRRVLFFCTSIY